ncbi:hypothetical protein STRDD10_00019 [Streptococcus sp. DD10]|uniref:diadenylate cyclase CdaA n=1 Tax=Streptococcus sp. DD10 TaxID=1777878 RepID=UPI0007926CD6|nr:diadenylate cyclase CdaA [Streptococcus sp. DD10]KXT77380.1 hypothetical protein STRDD10_00019 [Streptococcus sp. DD10]
MNFQQLSNLQYWESIFSSPWAIFINFIDIILVTWLLYYFIRAIVGTKIMVLVRGVLLFVFAQVIASALGLRTISWLMNQVITYGVIAAVIIFAPEIRALLEKLGRATLFSSAQLTTEDKLIQAFVKSVEYMSPRKIGALVTIEGSRTLQEYIATGIPLDAAISSELLINIFIPNTPLHDGAVIVRNDKIAVASAYLPLSESTSIPKEFGTRHRAAIGVSEVSDAFTFVVSEETGAISITHNGIFQHDLTLEEFEIALRKVVNQNDAKSKNSLLDRLTGGKKE